MAELPQSSEKGIPITERIKALLDKKKKELEALINNRDVGKYPTPDAFLESEEYKRAAAEYEGFKQAAEFFLADSPRSVEQLGEILGQGGNKRERLLGVIEVMMLLAELSQEIIAPLRREIEQALKEAGVV